MIDTPTIENVFALSQIKPFDALTESELLLIGQHVRLRSYDPGASLIKNGNVAEVLFIRLKGDLADHGVHTPDVFDAPSVLFGSPARRDYSAGPTGIQVFGLTKPHLFTIARECPDFIVGLAEALRQP